MSRPIMTPPTGERLLRYVGDTLRFTLRGASPEQSPANGWQAKLRTHLGRAAALRDEIIQARSQGVPFAGASWRDLPMRWEDGEWTLTLPLAEVGFFKAKAYLIDPKGYQVWPDGADFGVSVHPDAYRTANTIYCAFARLFGENKTASSTADKKLEAQMNKLDERGFTVIPPSGKLRELTRELPHIFGTLGCRILHLLPVNPTPTTFARMGRFGSPYACGDLTAIDPALVEFDKRTTGVEQFRELTFTAHSLGGKVFLDLVINHTGWDSSLRENHPEWYLRDGKGNFISPGAWGVVWADLVELEQDHPELWEYLAEVFLTWCRRGVDGFRCDAGYKVPMPVWQYITARVRQEFPDTIFLLEGLGGGWWETDALLTEGGMQWAYSELFQEFTGAQVQGYLDHALIQSKRVGVLVHYSETHDNLRLAAKESGTGILPVKEVQTPVPPALPNRAWSLHRNRLCALTSVNGGFGFTCGVEWLATEKIRVHECAGLNWGSKENIVSELAKLNQLLAGHPCFFDGATLTRLSPPGSPVYALLRESAEGKDDVLVLANTDATKEQSLTLDSPVSGRVEPHRVFDFAGKGVCDLLGQAVPKLARAGDELTVTLVPLACHCLALSPEPLGLAGGEYRRAHARAAWAAQAAPDAVTALDWRALAQLVDRSPFHFLAAVQRRPNASEWAEVFESSVRGDFYPQVVSWHWNDRRRVTPIPPNHWLLVEDDYPFRATLQLSGEATTVHAQSILAGGRHVAAFSPRKAASDVTLELERYAEKDFQLTASLHFLGET
ncbi:MAG: amylo-alpha-1,6-glucosidase, partial [Verrucomicrobia bacterium]|nr:amylo-alpha-1,6-glucosidase [Verrucomicrobiota bacterium]